MRERSPVTWRSEKKRWRIARRYSLDKAVSSVEPELEEFASSSDAVGPLYEYELSDGFDGASPNCIIRVSKLVILRLRALKLGR